MQKNQKNKIMVSIKRMAATAGMLILTFPLGGCLGKSQPANVVTTETTTEANMTSADSYEGRMSLQIELYLNAGAPRASKIIAGFDGNIESDESLEDLFLVRTGRTRADLEEVYLSDEDGNPVEGSSSYITFVTNPETTEEFFTSSDDYSYTVWVDSYDVTVKLLTDRTISIGGTQYSSLEIRQDGLEGVFSPLGDSYVKDTYTSDKITLQRALWTPEDAGTDNVKNPLIVWLHGGGEGGTDVDIALYEYNPASMAEEKIQSYFTTDDQAGAYVAVIQCPTMWLDCGDGVIGAWEESPDGQVSIYTEALDAALQDILSDNPDIDPARVYLTGCSNGGFMTLNMAVHYGNKYAAYVPICEAYNDANLPDSAIETLKDLPIWFIQSDDDDVVNPVLFGVPTYYRLMEAGADDVWYTMLTGWRHESWKPFLADEVTTVFDPANLPTAWETEFTNENCTLYKGSVFDWLAEK